MTWAEKLSAVLVECRIPRGRDSMSPALSSLSVIGAWRVKSSGLKSWLRCGSVMTGAEPRAQQGAGEPGLADAGVGAGDEKGRHK